MNNIRRLKVSQLSDYKRSGNTVVTANDPNSDTELEFVTPTKTAPHHGAILTVNISWKNGDDE